MSIEKNIISITCHFKSNPFDKNEFCEDFQSKKFRSLKIDRFGSIKCKHQLPFALVKISTSYDITISCVKNIDDAKQIILKINPECSTYIDNVTITLVKTYFLIGKKINLENASKIFGVNVNKFLFFRVGSACVTLFETGKIGIAYAGKYHSLSENLNHIENTYNFVLYKLLFNKWSLKNIKHLTFCKKEILIYIVMCFKHLKVFRFIPKALLFNIIFPKLVENMCLNN